MAPRRGRLRNRIALSVAFGVLLTLAIAWACHRWAPISNSSSSLMDMFAGNVPKGPWLVKPPPDWPPTAVTLDGSGFGNRQYQQVPEGGQNRPVLAVFDAGYPFYALRSWARTSDAPSGFEIHGVQVGTGERALFPILPLWPGLLLDVLLYSTATYLVCFGAGFVRRYRRRARGHCPSCNYDLSGLPPGSPCPECAARP
jgi:hypothetical protein